VAVAAPERPQVAAPPDLLLQVKDLRVHFPLDEGTVKAVDGVSYELNRGRTLGIVGESGCGKSVTAQAVLRITPRPGRVVDGEIIYHRRRDDGTTEAIDLAKLDPRGEEIQRIRGKEIAYISQEPMAALSPVHRVGHLIGERLRLHLKVSKDEARERTIEILARVGMPRPRQMIDRYPHQMSGGQRQRAVIAMALCCGPSLLIADEPTTALDVTTEAQILELMTNLQRDFHMSMQFITHNLGVIAELADDVVVMYLGKQVEQAPVEELFFNPKHPYTKALLRSVPQLGKKSRQRLESIKGMVPDPYNIPPGCAFHPRCPYYKPGICDDPEFRQVAENHWVRCSRAEELHLAAIDSAV
jgi:peptide/nickel transport system ATP-binding protein